MSKVAEIVTFRLADGTSETKFLATMPAVKAFLEGCAGFVRRRLSVNEDGTWVDHVEWSSLEEAEAASARMMSEDALTPFMQAIDGDSIDMRHNRIAEAVG